MKKESLLSKFSEKIQFKMGKQIVIKFTNLPVFTIPATLKFFYLNGRLGVSKSRKPFTLMKFLLKKFQVTKDNTNEVERFIFLLSLEKVLEKLKDPLYFKKYSKEFKELEYLIEMFLKGKISNPNLVNWERYNNKLPTEIATFGYLNQMILDLDKVLTKISLPRSVRTKSIRTRYIGVGYKDKGKLRISSYDGSPSWQEVSMKNEDLTTQFTDVFLLRQKYSVELFSLSDSQLVSRTYSKT